MLLTARSLDVEHTATLTPLSIASSAAQAGQQGSSQQQKTSRAVAPALSLASSAAIRKCRTRRSEPQGQLLLDRWGEPPATSAAQAQVWNSSALTDKALHSWPHRQRPRLNQLVEDVCLQLVQLLEEGLARSRVCGMAETPAAGVASQVRPGAVGPSCAAPSSKASPGAASGSRCAKQRSRSAQDKKQPPMRSLQHPLPDCEVAAANQPAPPTRHAGPRLAVSARGEVVVHALLAAANLQQHAVLLQAPLVVQPCYFEEQFQDGAGGD